MTVNGFLRWDRKLVYINAISASIWISLASFSILAKGSLGQEMLPVMESLIYIIGILGIKLAYASCKNYSFYVLIETIIDSLFLSALLYILYTTENLNHIGYLIYTIIILSIFTRPILKEKKRQYEDRILSHSRYKNILEKNRKNMQYLELVGGASGAIVSVIILSGLKIDIILFAKAIITLDIITNISIYYYWNKYLR